MNWHDKPAVRLLVHVPSAPLVGAVTTHNIKHIGAVSTPFAEQLVAPDAPYPASHVNWHVVPSPRLLVHVPSAPLVGAVTAHGPTVGDTVGAVVLPSVPTSISILKALVGFGEGEYVPA